MAVLVCTRLIPELSEPERDEQTLQLQATCTVQSSIQKGHGPTLNEIYPEPRSPQGFGPKEIHECPL